MTKKSNTLPVGYRLNRYCIEAVLGAGGFGITYKAVHEALQTRAAIKEYFPVEWSYRDRNEINVLANTQGAQPTSEASEDACYAWGLERFLNEARILAQVSHPSVVRVRDFFEANGTAYIVMDYEDGEALSQLLQREKTLPEEQVRCLISDILSALKAVHDQGYLHRDLKPANLYVRADKRTILIDFGAARQALGRRSKSVTSVFSPGYSPIEQYLIEGKGYGPWTDIYAMGAVLYHCVTGIAPIEAPARVLDDPLQPAEEVAQGKYDPVLLRLIDRAMAVRPERRFQSIEQMRMALESPLEEDVEHTVKLELPLRSGVHRGGEKPHPIASEPVSEPSPISPQPFWAKWHWGIGILMMAALVGGGIAYWLTGPSISHPVPPSIPPLSSSPPKPIESPPAPPAKKGPPTTPKPAQVYTEPETGMSFAWVPAGCFTMGSPETEKDHSTNEIPHQLCLKGFWMGRFEVTNGQYQRFDTNHDSGSYDTHSLNAPEQPVVRVKWGEAVAYTGWLSKQMGLNVRLPTEAEWEYAARAGKTDSREWGDDPKQSCNYANIYDETAKVVLQFNWANYPCQDGQAVAAPVGKYKANGFGLYDTLGNAAEWTCSDYDSAYSGGEARCADRNMPGGRRMLRGASWSDYPGLVRFAYRFPASPEYGKFDLGFRLVLEP